MKDFTGREFEVGQTVAICVPYYKHLVMGKVVKIGAKMVTCSYDARRNRLETTSRFPNQVVIVND